ncbi:hypothetical protein [Henriciella aquimarina]|uniref:hypothetical protein n=1 Tax=Henriciella aquimarina TaxID=545261 RepID=UPI0009FDB00E|nr:hypothetical protein [Henriciella aquimarina]
MAIPLIQQIDDTARFTAVHAALAPEDETSVPWLLTGAVLMVQQVATLALAEAGAELPAMPGPSELVARVANKDHLAQPYTAPLKPADHRAFQAIVEARNSVMHPGADGLSVDRAGLPEGLLVAAGLVRHLILTQPVRPSMVGAEQAASIRESLTLIETSVDFWRTVLA